MAWKVKTEPGEEPVSLQEAKDHLRVDLDDEDLSISGFITAARVDCEKFQNRAYITQTIELWLDEWPDKDFIELPMPPVQEPAVTAGAFVTGVVYRILTVGTTNFTLIGAASSTVGVIFTVTGLGSGTGTATASGIISYYGTDNTVYYMDGADLFLDIKSEPGRICLADGKSWPGTSLRPYNGMCVTYIAGYGEASAVPQNIKMAMLLRIGHYYEHREDVITGISAMPMPQAAEDLLWKDRIL